MTQVIEQYIDSLLRDPHASPPQNMDAGTAAFVRAIVASGRAKPTAAARARVWQRALDAAMTTNPAQNYTTSIPHSANGHRLHSNNHGTEPLARIPIPKTRIAGAPHSSRFRGILTLAAAFVLVLFGIVLLAMVGTPGTTQNAPSGEQNSGSTTPTETPTSFASGTPIPTPTLVPGSAEVQSMVEYTIRPGDTLLGIIQSPPFNFSDPGVVDKIIALNPTMDMSQLPPGATIIIPLPTPKATPVATIPGTRLPSNLASIMNDLQSLTGNSDAGQALFESAACSACHANDAISTLTEILWQSAEDTIQRPPQFSGYTAEMYIVESIIHPSAYIVPGYSNLMPDTYRENLSATACRSDRLPALLRAAAAFAGSSVHCRNINTDDSTCLG